MTKPALYIFWIVMLAHILIYLVVKCALKNVMFQRRCAFYILIDVEIHGCFVSWIMYWNNTNMANLCNIALFSFDFEFSARSCPKLIFIFKQPFQIWNATNDLKCHQTEIFNIITVTWYIQFHIINICDWEL